MLWTIGIIAVGAAIGANLRYFLTLWIAGHFGTTFPYGTLIINVSGGFGLGLVYTLLLPTSGSAAPTLRLLLGVGLLGGYTTFSTFSYETYQLLVSGNIWPGLLNALLSVVGSLTATLGGVACANLIRRG